MRNIAPQFGKNDTTLLTITQFFHFSHLHLAGHSKASQILALFIVSIRGIHFLKKFERRLRQIQDVDEMLGKPSQFQMSVGSNITQSGVQFSRHEFDQCRFTCDRYNNDDGRCMYVRQRRARKRCGLVVMSCDFVRDSIA